VQSVSWLGLILHFKFACMLENCTRATGCAFGALAPCNPFLDNLESNSGLNFNADCTDNSETSRALRDCLRGIGPFHWFQACNVFFRALPNWTDRMSVFDPLQCPIVCVCVYNAIRERESDSAAGFLRSHRTLRLNVLKKRF